MSNDSAGRTPRSTTGGSSTGSTVAIVVTAIAVILGFLILRKVNDHSDSTTTPGGGTSTTSTTVDPTQTTVIFTTTTQAPVDKTATKVQVANASNASGVAGQMTTNLSNAGWDTAEATNATVSPKLDISRVIYDPNDPNGQAVATELANLMGGITVEASTAAPPVKDGAFASGSGVILLLGNDLAGKTLEQITPATGPSAAPTTQPAAVTAVPTTTA
jgi:hypothetical protein